MLAIDLEFLSGACVATAFNDRRIAEWPPHPARLFAALVAAWADNEDLWADEFAALVEFERLDPPRIAFDPEPSRRSVIDHFVPDNDVTALTTNTTEVYRELCGAILAVDAAIPGSKDHGRATRSVEKAKARAREASARVTTSNGKESASQIAEVLRVLPDERGKQARAYPTVVPANPVVRYEWADGTLADVKCFDRVLARVHRIGHSSSFVSCTLAEELLEDPGSNRVWMYSTQCWTGDAERLRVPGEGMLRRLVDAYTVHAGSEPRVTPSRTAFYIREGSPTPARSVHSGTVIPLPFDRVVRPPLHRAPEFTRALRGALMSWCPEQPAPEFISGHAEGEGATDASSKTHVACIAFPAVGFEHASGALHGLALVLPASADPDEEQLVRAAIARWREAGGRLLLEGGRSIRIAERFQTLPFSARAIRWTRASTRWASALPIALDRYPKRSALDGGASVIADSCERLGLPRPSNIEVSNDPFVAGSRPVRSLPPFNVKGRNRPMLHAQIEFPLPIIGPLLIGAGRYYGHGLCVPLGGGDGDDG